MSTLVIKTLTGTVLFVVCCLFYLAWWLVSFRPGRPQIGEKMAWLLIPAAVAGLAGVVLIIWAMADAASDHRLFANIWVLVGGIVAFFVLLVITRWLFDRPVTSELILFTGWAALALAEVNALYGAGIFSRPVALVWIGVVVIVLLACLVCYVLYYRLDLTWRYYDGMAPLILTGLTMVGIAVNMLAHHTPLPR